VTPALKQKLVSLLSDHEGRIPWMYPDSNGNVTVGVGHLLPSALSAMNLGFPFWINRRKATAQEICSAWAYVRHTSTPFKTLTLAEPDIDALLGQDLERFEPIVAATFPNIVLPESAEIAVWDMVFNLGSFAKFPKFVAAVRAGDWAAAAAESKRRDIGVSRNRDTAQAFLALLPREDSVIEA
jgi:GH24 family phage-related lysozyme (muramidase)